MFNEVLRFSVRMISFERFIFGWILCDILILEKSFNSSSLWRKVGKYLFYLGVQYEEGLPLVFNKWKNSLRDSMGKIVFSGPSMA